MGLSPENASASPAPETRKVAVQPAKQPVVETCVNPSCVQQSKDYTQLRERFLRTTNALASATHDLKTPLAILNGYVEVLQSEKLGTVNERQREMLRDMHASGQRLQHFIQDFLSYSTLETGEMRMRYEAGNMNTCLSEVCRLWSPRFQERGLALYFLVNDKLPEFSFDAPKIERVISNLLENASKFTSSGGTVWLHAEPYMWERRTVKRTCRYGSPPQRSGSAKLREGKCFRYRTRHFPRISHGSFRRFLSRPPNRKTGRRNGIGFAHRAPFDQQHGRQDLGGERSGSGLQVFIHHPTHTRSQRCQREKQMSETAKILLVDDEPGMLRYIRTLLEVDGHKVDTASTGEEAVERIQKGLHPDLVLLDLLMPGIDGLQTLEQIRQIQVRNQSGDALLCQ